ncbi:UDP-3-O-glucosamine N-acyltransferase [Fomitiporia mediterranea MF3/22]|uniref:UDP-3-O-glucosamine N-acyltransferase n=1 Tax=Fomitiporia mediterranea (strain MF3/22) TaxID=694068 RepID=UPI0004407DE4|nr:UDP-3-O-glucosamine N-acyltransferase [Fomitiporia mediterranea MF3/22]EJD02568.1 UDP-3-O-glucosamine N-acyltransferase [Fomitiporia mediterranea MF3/22]
MNFTDTSSVRYPREFLAVILAGFGNELQPLTSNYGDQPCPKALLPIGNKPMISYVLNWVEEAGLKDVLLICPTSHRDAISHHINSDPSSSSLSNLSVEIQTYDQSQDIPAGTASILAHFATRISNDFVLLPCDFIPPPSLRLESVLDKFRVEVDTDGALATALFFEQRPVEGEKGKAAAVEETWGAPTPPWPVVYDANSGTLLHVDTLDDQDRDGDELAIRMCTLCSYPRTTLSTRLVDAHVYVCRHAVLDALQMHEKRHIDSFREEFLPWLCKVHTHRTKRTKYSKVLSPITNNTPTQALALQHSTSYPPSLQKLRAPSSLDSADSSPAGDEENSESPPPSLRIGLVIHPFSKGYAARANNLQAYLELNRAALGRTAPPTHDPALRALIDAKANITPDSLIGSSTRVGERSTIKHSAIGSHCTIGKNVRLTGCVLMEYCVVEDGAKLDGCILGKNTRVGVKAEVVKCVTQAGFEVEEGGVYKHEKLDVSDWTAGADEEDEEDEDEDAEEKSSEDSDN